MNPFTLILLAIFAAEIAAVLLGKVKSKTSLRSSVTMLMTAGIIYYAVAPIMLIPIPLPLTLFVQCIGYVCLLISLKSLVDSMLE